MLRGRVPHADGGLSHGLTCAEQTPSQTVGPFFSFGLTPEQYGYAFRSIAGSVLIDDGPPGARIRIVGRVYDAEPIR